jgi:hypothetical protein
MKQAPRNRVRRNGSKAAAAALTSALVIVPAGIAHAANRAAKKLTRKQVLAQIKRNEAVLKKRFAANPRLAYRSKPAKVSAAPAARYGYGRSARRAGGAEMSQVETHCSGKPAASWGYNNTDPRVSMSWGFASTCTGKPVATVVDIDMVDPTGVHHPNQAKGGNFVQVADGSGGPKGTWTLFHQVTWTLSAGTWKTASPGCAGVGTPVVTCKGATGYTA